MALGRGSKISNEYAQAFGKLYERTPKAVFAAVAFSYANWAGGQESNNSAEIIQRFLDEWRILHENGIVVQAPDKKWLNDALDEAAKIINYNNRL